MIPRKLPLHYRLSNRLLNQQLTSPVTGLFYVNSEFTFMLNKPTLKMEKDVNPSNYGDLPLTQETI